MELLKDNNTLLVILDNLKNTYNLHDASNTNSNINANSNTNANSKIVIKILRKLEILKNLIHFNNPIWNYQIPLGQCQTDAQQFQQQSKNLSNGNNTNGIMDNGVMDIGIDDETGLDSNMRIHISYDLAIYELNYLYCTKKLYTKIERVSNLLGFIINTIMINDNYDLIIQNANSG